MDRAMVTVVMAAYNNEAYIDEAIRGVVGQRVDWPIELLILDDCSTDATGRIADDWARRRPDIVRVVHNTKNIGLLQNYLQGFREATGRYMALCDADDYWHDRRKLRRQVEYMESHPDCSLTFHRVVNYYEASGEKSLSNGGLKEGRVATELLSRSNPITNLSVVYRREMVDLSRLPEWINDVEIPDYSTHLLYASRGYAYYFSRPMGTYRQRSTATWSMADRYRRLSFSLGMREILLRHFADRRDMAEGLRSAAIDIAVAMIASAGNDQEERAARERLSRLDPELDPTERIASLRSAGPSRRPLKSRLRGALSRLLPRPLPPRE